MLTKALREEKELRLSVDRIGISYDDGLKLVVFSRQLHKIAERKCNGFHSWEKQREKWNNTREDNIKRDITNLLASYSDSLYFYHQSDPRGYYQVYVIDMDNPKFINHFSDWVARNSYGNRYYGTNLHEFADCVYNRYGIAF